MEYEIEEKSAPGREKVEVLGGTYEPGKPDNEDLGRWRQKLSNRLEKLKYLRTGERYLYGKDWYGSEKRKNPA
ncbi:MAG: hypothetical protein R6T78_02540 [Dehalococcoidales bacterium]